MKKIIIIILALLGSISLGIGIYLSVFKDKAENGSEQNIMKKEPITNETYFLSSAHIYEDLSFTGVVIQKQDNKYVFYSNVTNKGNKDIKFKEFVIVLLDQYYNEIIRINSSISDIESGFSKQLVIESDKDIFNAYDYKIISK